MTESKHQLPKPDDAPSVAHSFTGIDPTEVYRQLEKAADEYANAERAALLAENMADTVYDSVFKALPPDAGAMELRKVTARSSELCKKARIDAIESRAKALKAKLKWQALMVKMDFLRTLETSLREQARRLGGAPGG